MDFALDERTEQLRGTLLEFMDSHIYPAEPAFAELDPDGTPRSGWDPPAVMEELKEEARRRGLWNLFYPEASAGGGLSLLSYATLAEVTGRSPIVAPEALNCSAPDTGNMELLHLFATGEQRTHWLEPLLDGQIRSAYCMTEPEVASSDANNLETRIRRDGDQYVIDGRKWWSTGIMAAGCQLLVVVGVTNPDAPARQRQSVVLVPKDTPGVTVKRGLSVLGFRDSSHGGHGEVVFEGVRVPASSLLGGEGRGAEMAQARLGPGRIHHCMRLVGMAERAFDLMCTRVLTRTTFGRPLADRDTVQETIAAARIRIDSARLLVLRAAWMIDQYGAREARTEISAVKVAVPSMVTWVVDRAMQVHGAGGLSADHPLATLYAQARGLRLADGPDEVHQMVVARRELARYKDAGGTP